MARPTKQGIDYFPIDVFFDKKVDLLIAETGAEGLGILVTIWQLIYSDNGYYINSDEDLLLLIRRRTMAETAVISELIRVSVARNIFDLEKYEKYGILTSKGVQNRFFSAAKKKKEVQVFKEYLCCDVSGVGNLVYSSLNHSFGIDKVDENATKEEVKEEVEVKEDKKIEKKEKFCPIKNRPDWINPSDWKTLIDTRKLKKVLNTEPALSPFVSQLKKAIDNGYTMEQCIQAYAESGWKRFKAEWMQNKGPPKGSNGSGKTFAQIRSENNDIALKEFAGG